MGRSPKTLAAACALLAAFGVGACNDEKQGVDEPAREGLALPLGGVDYNVFITRELNPRVPPDDAYYPGPDPPAGQTLYGIFIQVCNKGSHPEQTARDFEVVDNEGTIFRPRELPADNKFAYHPSVLQPEECIPVKGSVAQLGPTAGAMLLFQLPLTNTENRPLELKIHSPSSGDHLTYELDL